jgi:phosphoserine aminotransferase
MKRVYNFAAGPAILPEAVLRTAQQDMLNWRDTGMSVMEVSHRSALFEELVQETQQLLRDMMRIPNNYQVLLMAAGGRGQFAAVPMNLLGENSRADYVVTGNWSHAAYIEAQKYGSIRRVLPTDAVDLVTIPEFSTWQLDPKARYLYYTPNETLLGTEFPYVPQVGVPLVADMTSCILSREYDVSQFGLIYAAAQKNLGQAGVTVVIVRDDLITEPLSITPGVLSYLVFRDSNSLYNTPATYAIYIMNLVLKYWQAEGGVAAIEKINQQKAQILYDYIDQSDAYVNSVDPHYRSAMNVSFSLPTPELNIQFVSAAKQHGLVNLKGHSRVGGLRASLYNAMPLAGVKTLIAFMQQFVKEAV